MTGIILAGGKNSRMGAKKAFLNIDKNTIIDNILSIYHKIFNEVIIVTNTPEDFKWCGDKLINDIILGCGPMGGIYSGLLAAKNKYCFVSACDMPFINEKLLRHIIKYRGFDAVVPVLKGEYNPLFALYSKNCCEDMKRQLEQGNYKLKNLLLGINVKQIYEDEMIKYDKDLLSLTNVNTPEEFKEALRIKKSKG